MYYFAPLHWQNVADQLRRQPRGSVVRYRKSLMEHPLDAGASWSIGMPQGQIADFRLRLPGCGGLHIRDFGSHYEAHIDTVDLSCNPIEHARRDAPEVYIAGAAALGALVALMLGGNRDTLLAGAGLGAALGVITVQDAASKSPARAFSSR